MWTASGLPKSETDQAGTETNLAEHGRRLPKSATRRGRAGGWTDDAVSAEPSTPLCYNCDVTSAVESALPAQNIVRN